MTETVDSLKQRLVGAIVIITLAIIFLPMIFDKPHQDESVVITPVPPKPEFRTFEISKPVKPTFEELKVDASDGKVKRASDIKKPADVNPIKQSENVVATEADVSAASDQRIESDKAVVKAPKKRITPKVSDLPVFKNIWMVQMGTFSNIKNAYRLRDQLREDGFDGHTKTITLNGKKAVKVFTGPFVKKREAEKAKKRLDKRYKVDSRIVFFDA